MDRPRKRMFVRGVRTTGSPEFDEGVVALVQSATRERPVELREIEAVLAVHECGSFSAAAIALFVSQPALTRRVAQLERELGARLFVRTSRGVRTTDAGAAFLEPARRALAEAAEIRRALGRLSRTSRPTLRITSAPSLGLMHLASVVAGFHDAYPEVDVTIARSESPSSSIAAVESGQFDLALVDTSVHPAGVVSTTVWEDEYLAIYAPAGRTQGEDHAQPYVTAELLQGRPMIYLAERSIGGPLARRLWDMVGVEPASTIETEHLEVLMALTLGGQGVAVVPHVLARQARSGGAHTARPPRPIVRSVALARRADESAPGVDRFVDFATTRRPLIAAAS